ncbi:MAG: MFS transporter [Nitriliruptoraceae bacterium]|nr:MFS transporter [Nitriliruptoraceae bacterium]
MPAAADRGEPSATPAGSLASDEVARSTARTSWALVTDRTFGPWFAGLLVSNSGNWLFNVTAAVVVFQLSRSALLVGLVSVAQFLPLVLLGPLAGAVSDRVDRRRLLLWSQVGSASAAGALGIGALLVGVEGFGSPWPVIAAAFGIGLGQAVANPALQALVPALVPDVDLESGVALTSLTFNVGRALGPAVSGAMLATVGAEFAFVVNAISFVVLVGALALIEPAPRPAPPAGTDTDRSVRAGLRFVRDDRVTLLLLVGIAAVGFSGDPAITLSPPMAAEFDGGDTLTAVLVSAFGIAAAPAALLSGRLARAIGGAEVAVMGGLAAAAGLLLTALAPVVALAVLGFGLLGAGFVFGVTGFTTLLYRRVPDGVRGRIMALWGVAFLGNRPFAAAIDGAASDAFGPRPAMTIAIVSALLGALLAWRLRDRVGDAAGSNV